MISVRLSVFCLNVVAIVVGFPQRFAPLKDKAASPFPLLKAYQGSEGVGDIFQKKQDLWKQAKETPTMPNRFITEKTEEIDSGKLSTLDASNYGICGMFG